MNFEAAAISDVGPRKINEDEVAYWALEQGGLVTVIADGLGGMGGGGDASSIALATLRRHLVGRDLKPADLMVAAKDAHYNIIRAQEASPELRRMATTLTAAMFVQNGLVGVHCGDTRAIIARGSGVLKLTTDQSEGERLFRAGKLSKEERLNYPRKNILDSALGVHNDPNIETFSFDLVVGDKIIFTTDGVHEKVLLREMREIVERHSRPSDFVKEVCDIVRLRKPEDNFSIAAVFVV